MNRKYHLVKQHDSTDCAAACMAMICLYYKKEITITELRDLMGTDIRGTNLIGISKCAEKIGFDCQAVRVDRNGLLSNYTLPCIANIITKEGVSHFIVIYKIKKRHIILGDPGKESVENINIEDFIQRFTGILFILAPTAEFKFKNENKQSTFNRFLSLLLPQKKLFAFAILASLIMTILGILLAMFNKIIMDEVIPYGLKNVLLSSLIIFSVVAFTQTVIGFLRSWIMLYLSQRIDIPLILGYFNHVYSLPMRFFSTRKTGDIITRFTDAFTIKDVFTNIALTLIMDIVMAIITGVILFKMSGRLFGIIVILTILSIILVFVFKQPYKKINKEQMQQSSILNSEIIEGLEAIETIKGNAIEDKELEIIEKEYIKSLRIAYKEGKLTIFQGALSEVISTLGNLFIMYFGIRQVLDGYMTIGSMMAFSTLSGYFMEPVGNLVGLQLDIQEAQISMKRISEILDYEKEIIKENENVSSKTEGDINFENVSFGYGNRGLVLNNISFSIEQGKKTAIVGASGSGKSTIVKLLLKYFDIENGTITIDGININEITPNCLRNNISLVPQDVRLFSKSIYQNVLMSKPEASEKDVVKALAMADAMSFVKKQPMQMHTILEDAGHGLSSGERQRIALARAFLKNTSLFILDEPTSSLDFGTETKIFDTIYNKLNGKTILIVAHRLSTIRNCDKIIVLSEGKIVEQGTHEELLDKRGEYYCLWELQQGEKTIKEGDNYVKDDKSISDDINTITYK
ncbi:MAG: peptidase domain-containing ABC transporter [Mogibacterium diversum]|nr:peptidase domain-containing ABC transporter [Mogibacterium diversum]